MILVDNYISKILHKDKDDSYSILTYIDIDEEVSLNFINEYINEFIKNNPILKKQFVEKDKLIFLDDIKLFKIEKYYTVKYTKQKNFDKKIHKNLNIEFDKNVKWKFLCYIDKKNKKTRLFFKIHHAYVDGYTLINMLLNDKNSNKNDIVKKFKRKTDFWRTIYYYLVGTIILIISNVKIITNTIFNLIGKTEKTKTKKEKTDYIICKPLNLEEIKIFSKKKDITVNDFLYSLMIKTDKLYTNKEKLISTCSSINVSGTKNTNNMCPIFNQISNSLDNNKLLKTVNSTFNNFKFSLFIPILAFIINNIVSYIDIFFLSIFYDNYTNNSDYIYSNIIGPSCKNISVKITNIHFLTTHKNKEIIYNIISNDNNINIICTFQKNVIKDKKKFEDCIYETYKNLINN